MVVLIFSGNLFSVIIGWDGLGVTSFLLVIFFHRKTSANAGLLTIFTNRVGDVLIIARIAFLLGQNNWGIGAFSYSNCPGGVEAMILIVIAAFTKSAQIPFSSWLPAAIAAPTPVSSLVHSSTLVTAGVYLLFRFKDSLFAYTPLRGRLLLMAGRATIVMAGTAGIYEDDLKKMVALSTLSQLGLIMASLGLGVPQLAFFHLLRHAYFKALLFMATGRVIHSIGGYQDMRVIRLPFITSVKTGRLLLVSNLSLIGFPFLAGFYSKDGILELTLSSREGPYLAAAFVVGTALTVMYRFRFLISVRRGGISRAPIFQHQDKDWQIFKGYDFLFVLAISGGSLLNHFYLRASPALFLSFELKNATLLLIRVLMVLRGAYRLSFSPKFKVVFATLLNLVLISKRFGKKYAFGLFRFNEKLIEKTLFKSVLFSSLSTSLATPRLLTSRSLIWFWLVTSLLGGFLLFA